MNKLGEPNQNIRTFQSPDKYLGTPENHCVFKFPLNCTEEKKSSQNQGRWQRRLVFQQELKAVGESLLIEKAELSEKYHATRSVQGLNLDQPNPRAKQNSQFGYNVTAKHQLSFIPSQS